MSSSSIDRQPSIQTTGRVVGKLLIDGLDDSVVTFPLLTAEVLIGRLDSVDLVLEDLSVSRVHAKIVREAGRDVIVDLESSTGTLVNGESIARHVLTDGDVVEIGSAQLRYRTT